MIKNLHFSARAALTLLFAVLTIQLWAETKTAYAVLTDNNDGEGTKTLTFKCEVHDLGTNEWDVSKTSGEPWSSQRNTITKVVFESSFADARPQNCESWFIFCQNLTTIEGIEYLNTCEVTNMSHMFNGCTKLTSLDVSNFDTRQVKAMFSMFCHCHQLTNLDLSNFDTSEVTNMSMMFMNCHQLTNLDLSNFDTGKVTTMLQMFKGSENLACLAISKGFKVTGSTTTTTMLDGCTALKQGKLILMGTDVPNIEQDIFGIFTDGTLITNLTKEQLGITGTATPYTWKGGTFKSVGGVSVQYLDENGETKTADNALPITAACTTLPGGWYYVESNVNLNHTLTFSGDAKLILSDGCKMVVENTNGHAISGDDNLTIYGQGGETEGGLTATGGPNGNGIFAKDAITINGGHVEATSIGNGHERDITINGGQVKVFGQDGIHSYNKIILGWNKATDYIYATIYNAIDSPVKTAAGKRFIAYNAASEGDISANCIIGSTTGETTLNNTDISNIAGKTLRPLDSYYLAVPTGTVVTGKTEVDGTTPKPDFTIDGKPYYIFKNGDTPTFTLADYGQDGVEVSGLPIDLAVTDRVPTIEFQMRNNDENITSKFYNTGVKYMDWDDTQKKLVEKTTTNDPDNNDVTKVYILTGGGATELPGGWYVAKGEVSYTGTVKFIGNAHLILADGANMTINTTDNNADAIFSSKSLTIYGQSIGKAMGKLNAHSEKRNGIYATTTASGINITINGGQVTATSGSSNVDGICASATVWGPDKDGYATVTINGGQVTATGGTYGKGIVATSGSSYATITLNLTNGSDFVKASSYSASGGNASVKIPAGKALAYTDGDVTTVLGSTDADYIFGATGHATLASIANQTLRASKDFPVSAGAQYAVICQNQGDWKVTDPDVKMYVPTGRIIKNGDAYEMELREVIDGGIPNGMPIIVAKEGGLGDIPVVGTSTEEANAIETNYAAANPSPTFFAADGTKTLNELIVDALGEDTDPHDYVPFTLVDNKLVAASNSGNVVKAGICIFVFNKFDVIQMARGTYNPPAASAPVRSISFDFDGGSATAISTVSSQLSTVNSDEWYTLQGVKLEGKPVTQGMYIYQGRKVFLW